MSLYLSQKFTGKYKQRNHNKEEPTEFLQQLKKKPKLKFLKQLKKSPAEIPKAIKVKARNSH